MKEPKKKNPWSRFAVVAAALVLALGLGAAIGIRQTRSVSFPSSASYISADEARAAALAHAGVKQSSTYGWEVDFDRDDGRTVYEIEFRSGFYEYNYEINAVDGSVRRHNREWGG